ncbi:MAG: hypothetical protein JXB85_06110 [Anaerolineales bacterium]|nr:hypothetical protein [Anaerolineales bacterium]
MVQRVLTAMRRNSYVAYAIALVGGILFFAQLWHYAHTQTTLVDEGMYLYFGSRFVGEGGIEYGNFGVWSYYPPLAFMIPGLFQQWFSPGLLAGRYYAVLISMVMVVTLWHTTKRLAGKWWAVALVWAVALMPIQIKIYSIALSQGLVACLLILVLGFVLGEKRSAWQIVVGSLLMGILIMTRQNMILALPILVAYVFFQHGRKLGWYSLAGCLLPIVVVHVLYWPNILHLWTYVLPVPDWLPLPISQYGLPENATTLWMTRAYPLSAWLMDLATGFRIHYLSLFGAIAVLLLWPRRGGWKSKADMRTGVFLLVLFTGLLLEHSWLSLGGLRCQSCFSIYLAFFSNVGLLLLAVASSAWGKGLSLPRQVIAVLFLLAISLGLGYAATTAFGERLIWIKIPSIDAGFRIGPGYYIWDILENRFQIPYFEGARMIAPWAGLILGGLLLVLISLVHRLIKLKYSQWRVSYGMLALCVFWGAGFVVSPLLNGPFREGGDCTVNVVDHYEENLGEAIAQVIPAGSQVYWNVDSAVSILYASDVDLHHTQLFSYWTYVHGGDTGEIEAAGYWNAELASLWIDEADVLVIEGGEQDYYPELYTQLDLSALRVVELPLANPCDAESQILVYFQLP